ncbi:LysR substrate-binding domain-containing protein, partial [Paraburkholderia sp. SIMBA_050]
VVDLVNEGFDCAIRLGDLPGSSLVSIRLAENRRVVVAAPGYLARAGTPKLPEDLSRHNCLAFGASANVQRGHRTHQQQPVAAERRAEQPVG